MSLELHLGIAGFEHSIAIYTTSLLSSIIYIYMFSKQTNKRLSLRQGFKTKSFWFLLAGPYQKKTQNLEEKDLFQVPNLGQIWHYLWAAF